MAMIIRLPIGLLGLFNLVLGLVFLLIPGRIAPAFFVAPQGVQGLATLRADLGGFFVAGAGFALMAAWRGQRAMLYPPLALLGLALTGRCVSIALDGHVLGTPAPMAVEAVMIAVLLLGLRK